MSVTIPISLVATTAALICGAIALCATALTRETASTPAWAAASLGALGLSTAAVSGSVRPLDLAAVAGVVLVGGVAGAGWSPRSGGLLLALGVLGFAASFLDRLYALSQSLGEPGLLDQLVWAVARSSGFAACRRVAPGVSCTFWPTLRSPWVSYTGYSPAAIPALSGRSLSIAWRSSLLDGP